MNSKLIVILIAGISLMGCTTMKPVDIRKSDLTEQLDGGDHLVVYEKSGRKVDMTLTLIDADYLRGTLGENTSVPVEVHIDDIETIESEKIAVARTAGAILGGIVLLPFAVLGLAMSGQ